MTISASPITEPQPYSEQRREPRTAVSDFVMIHADRNNNEPAPGMLTDVSDSGLGIVLSIALDRGSHFSLSAVDTGETSITPRIYAGRRYRVVHCQRIRGGLFSIGAAAA